MSKSRRVFLLALFLAPVACFGPGGDVEIQDRRQVTATPMAGSVGLTPGQRFGRDPIPPPPPDFTFDYDLPEGWTEVEATRMRMVNLQPAGNRDAECYVSLLGGSGGGLAANINRWRGQMGLEKMSETEIVQLPTTKLFGGDAFLIELRGDFVGMGTTAKEEWGMLGAILSSPQLTIFVKMTCPGEMLETEREAFLAFTASVDIVLPGEEPGVDPEVETGSEPGPAAPEEPSGSPTPIHGSGFRGLMPANWKDAGPRTMVAINMAAAPNTECFLVVLGGEGGGLLPNINRWQDQLGLDHLSDAQVETLPRIEMCGGSAHLLVAHGDFRGMSGDPQEDFTLIGAALLREHDALFLKMVGPQAEVATLEEEFLAFAASLEEMQ